MTPSSFMSTFHIRPDSQSAPCGSAGAALDRCVQRKRQAERERRCRIETKGLKKRYRAKREDHYVSFGSRIPCERLSFQRAERAAERARLEALRQPRGGSMSRVEISGNRVSKRVPCQTAAPCTRSIPLRTSPPQAWPPLHPWSPAVCSLDSAASPHQLGTRSDLCTWMLAGVETLTPGSLPLLRTGGFPPAHCRSASEAQYRHQRGSVLPWRQRRPARLASPHPPAKHINPEVSPVRTARRHRGHTRKLGRFARSPPC